MVINVTGRVFASIVWKGGAWFAFWNGHQFSQNTVLYILEEKTLGVYDSMIGGVGK